MSNINKEIQEAFGGIIGGDIYNPDRTVGYNPYPKAQPIGGIDMAGKLQNLNKEFVIKQSPWQEKITNKILAYQHLFINVSPSGGKTLPVITAWSNLLKHWTASGRTTQKPTILFVAKTKQLALQVYTDLRKVLEGLIISGGLDVIGMPNITTDSLNVRWVNYLKSLLNSLVVIRTGGGPRTPFGTTITTSDTLAIVATPPLAGQIIKDSKIKFRIVVIDELQEYLNKPAVGASSEEPSSSQDVKDMVNIIKEASKDRHTSIVLMTGSLNEKTTISLISWLKLITKHFRMGKEFYLVKEAVKNRSYIKVIPVGDLRTGNDLANLADKIITNKQTNSLLILFSVGKPGQPIKPSIKKNIISISEKLIRTLPKKSPEAIIGTSINRRTTTQNMRDNELASHIGGVIQSFRRNDLDELKDMLNGYSIINGKRFPRDQLLGECILRGFGYIAGGSQRIKAMGHNVENMDTIFVQKLFKEGKIPLIIATDAVGVGANLKVRHMYIPSLQKFNGGAFGPINDSTLMQIVHRAGRHPQETAVIYCDNDDIGRVSNAINTKEPYIAIPEVSTKNVNMRMILSIFYSIAHSTTHSTTFPTTRHRIATKAEDFLNSIEY